MDRIQEEDQGLLRKWQGSQFSRVGLVAASFMLITFLAQIVIVVFASLMNRILGGAIDIFSGTGLIIISAIPMYCIAFPVSVLLIQLVPKCGSPQRQRWGLGMFACCLVISVGMGLAGNLLGQAVEWFRPSGAGGSDLDSILMDTSMWMNILFTVIAAPIVEELFFRKMIMDRLLGFGEGPAILMSGLMFGMAHGNFSQFFYAFGIGTLWAYVYAKTGKVSYTIAFHMIFNFLGGVMIVELSKGAGGMMELPWFFRGAEYILGLDLSGVIAVFSGILLLGYSVFMLACLIGGIVILVLYRKDICFAPGRWPIRKGRRFRTVVLNMGMILYFLVCIGLFIVNW